MSIETTFNNSKEVILPKDFLSQSEKTYQTIIVHFSEKTSRVLEDQGLIFEIPNQTFNSDSNTYRVYQHHQYEDILVFKSPIGAPSTVAFLEEITYFYSIKHIVMFGSAGVLQADIVAGKIIVPTRAYRDEGTSYHYAEASDFIDIVGSSLTMKVLTHMDVDFVSGGIWTTDAFYRETMDTMNTRKQQGCIAVDMEISAVQAFAQLRGLSFYPFVYGADNLDSSEWDKRVLGSLSYDSRLHTFLLATAIAKAVMNS